MNQKKLMQTIQIPTYTDGSKTRNSTGYAIISGNKL